MECSDQRLQLLTGSPVRVLVAVLLRVITHSVSVGTWRQPDQVKRMCHLLCLRQKGCPFRISVFIRTQLCTIRPIRLVIERLNHHVLALTGNGTACYRLPFATCARNIDLVRTHLELQIEIIGARLAYFISIILDGKLITRVCILGNNP